MAVWALIDTRLPLMAWMISIRIFPPSSGGMGRRFMSPSDSNTAARRAMKSDAPELAACDAMTEIPTTDDDWLTI